MSFDYAAEGSFFALNKLRNLDPYFNIAVHYLSGFSESIRAPQGEGVFEIPAKILYPRIAFLDDPYPIIQCRQRIFSGKKRIELSYGIFTILGLMGAFEKAIDEVISGGTEQNSLSMDSIWKADISGLVRCIEDALDYLKRSYNAYPEEAPEIPPLTLSTDLLDDALKFIVGHELSHYLDVYYNYDFRNRQQLEVLNNCFELLKELKGTPYKKYADRYLESLEEAEKAGDRYLQVWSEEVLADLEGYHYICTGVPIGRSGIRKLLAISLSFLAMRIVEYFESTLASDAPEGFYVPIRWRAAFLQYMIYKKYGSNYEYFNEFVANEWGIYQIAGMLFDRALLKVRSNSGRDGKEEEAGADVARKDAFCKELLEKMSAASVFEAETIFDEVDAIYHQNISDPGFRRAFQTKEMARILCRLGDAFYELKQYKEAYKWFYRGSAYFESSKELPGLPEADCYERMGDLRYGMGDYGGGAGWYKEALFIRQEVLRLPFQDNAAIHLRLARALIMSGQDDAMEKHLKTMLELAEDDDVKAEVFRNLGIMYDDHMDYAASLKSFQMAADIKRRLFGEESLEMATLYNSIGTILSNLEEFDAAEAYLRHSLRIKLDSETDPISLTNSMFNLGMLELRRACYPEALKWLREVLDIRLIYLEEDHPLVADTLQSIGAACFFQNRYDEARACGRRAADIFRKRLGRSHLKTRRAELLLEKIDGADHH